MEGGGGGNMNRERGKPSYPETGGGHPRNYQSRGKGIFTEGKTREGASWGRLG